MNWDRISPQTFARVVGVLLFGSVLLGTAPTALSQGTGNVPFVSGGAGEESRDELNRGAANYNLKLVHALKTGAYLADVKVKITDSNGKTLLDTITKGPWLFARLPAGSYTVVSTYEGKSTGQKITIAASGSRTLDFRW